MKTRHPVQLSGLLKCIWTTMITMKWRNKLHQLSQTGTQEEKHKYFLLTNVSQTHLTPQKEPCCLNHVEKIPLTTCKSSLNQLLTVGDLHLPESRWQEVKQKKNVTQKWPNGTFSITCVSCCYQAYGWLYPQCMLHIILTLRMTPFVHRQLGNGLKK